MKRLAILLLFVLPSLFSCTRKENPSPEIKPEVRVQSVSVSPASKDMTIGETLQLSATVSPANATKKDISWSSSNVSVASVNSSGLVTALSDGTTMIIAIADRKMGTCSISVAKAYVAVAEVKFENTELSLYEGDETMLTASVLPEDATDKTIAWSSSDNSVATVESGKVKAIKEGTATITASAGAVKAECKLTVYLKYSAVAITNLKPVDILPIVGQVEAGDKKAYDHIEHLRLAEATRIRDMMWEYGAGNHSIEEYRQLMGKLNAGMRGELPFEYDNYELIGNTRVTPDNHAHIEWHTLTLLLNHANLKIIGGYNYPWQAYMLDYLHAHPNSINIFGSSAYSAADNKTQYEKSLFKADILELCESKNFIIFAAGTNIKHPSGITKNKIYNGEYEADEHGTYSLCSMANSDKNTHPGSHLLVTVATNSSGDIDQTNERYESSKFPVGFANDVLFAGRAFPYHSIDDEGGRIVAEAGKYATSHTNYVNVAMMGICFQLYAEVKDVDELLEMVRSTCLTDHIRFEGQDQPLQLINHAGFIKKYLIPKALPTAISAGETISLDKGYYKGVLFSIPGAEVKIGGDWIAFDNKNRDVILSQNPMTLEWRLNGDLLKRYGYASGQTVEGQVITVDDNWGGLRLEVPMTVQLR
jgi:hypothetical protein